MNPPATPAGSAIDRRAFLGSCTLAGAAAVWAENLAAAAGAGAGVDAAPGARAAAAAGGSGPTSSSVGSLFPFIRSQAVRGEFPLSFLNPRFKSVSAWRKTARGRLLELLHYAPAPVDPKGETTERTDCGDYIRERVEFNTTPDLRVPALVLIPKEGKRPLPAIVALHDHGGFYLWGKEKIVEIAGENPELADFRRQYYGGRSIAVDLVRQGYVVVVIDMFYWGERRMILDLDPEDWRTRPATLSRERIQAFNRRSGQAESLVGRTIYSAGFTWPGVMFWDDLRTVDYLLARPEVDRQRIGCVGLSVGGLRACHLAALDERIRAAVVVGWMASFPWQLQKQVENTIGHTKIVPGLYREMDYPDVASLAMPRPLLVINGSRDGLFHLDGVKASFDKLHACYRKAGAKEHIGTLMYDTPHEFNTDMQTEAWAWLRKWV